jgi:hypothetical protein
VTRLSSRGLEALAEAPSEMVAEEIMAITPQINIGKASRSIILFLAILSPIGIVATFNTTHYLGHLARQASGWLLIPYIGE